MLSTDPEANPLGLTQPRKRHGMFGGGTTIDLNGALAGFLAGMGNPAGAIALRSLQENRQRQAEAQQQGELYQQQRQDKFTDWRQQFDYEQQHKAPDLPPMVRDVQAWQQMSDPQREAYEALMAARSGGEFVSTTLPTGEFYAGSRAGLMERLGGAPQVAPKGVTFKPRNGGQAVPPPATFPDPLLPR